MDGQMAAGWMDGLVAVLLKALTLYTLLENVVHIRPWSVADREAGKSMR